MYSRWIRSSMYFLGDDCKDIYICQSFLFFFIFLPISVLFHFFFRHVSPQWSWEPGTKHYHLSGPRCLPPPQTFIIKYTYSRRPSAVRHFLFLPLLSLPHQIPLHLADNPHSFRLICIFAYCVFGPTISLFACLMFHLSFCLCSGLYLSRGLFVSLPWRRKAPLQTLKLSSLPNSQENESQQ